MKDINSTPKDYIYRYRSNSFYSMNSRLNNETTFVCPLELNDPFEFYIKYDIDKVYDLIKSNKRVKSIVASKLFKNLINFEIVCKEGFSPKPKTIKECVSIFDDESRLEQNKKYLINFISKKIIQFKESFMVISLTRVKDNPVMWSHYSSDSHGFLEAYDLKSFINNFNSCLAYDYKELPAFQFDVIGAFEVDYVDRFVEHNELIIKLICADDDPNINIGIDFIENENMAKEVLSIIKTKQSVWSYEKEIRLIIPFDLGKYDLNTTRDGKLVRNHFMNFGLDKPCEIIMGNKANKETEYALNHYCAKENIAFGKMNELFETIMFTKNI